MPTQSRKKFQPQPCPPGIGADDLVYYLPLTNEVFTSYDDFFERQISLSSMIWTCSVTGKSGLTYEEALESEKSGLETLKTFPECFGRPILYLVQQLSCRGRIDDLVNDIYFFVKDHFLVGEELLYVAERGKRTIRVLSVSFVDHKNVDGDQQLENIKIPQIFTKRGELLIAPADHYKYTILILDERCDVEGERVRENVQFHQLMRRSKSIWTRNMLRVFLRNSCSTDEERFYVKDEIVSDYKIDKMTWTDVFGGPIAQFPKTPLMHRKLCKGTARPPRNDPAENPHLLDSSDDELKDLTEPSKKRSKKISIDDPGAVQTVKKSKKKNGESAIDVENKNKNKKKRVGPKKAVVRQQEELESLFEQARQAKIENLSHWQQEERLLTTAEIVELKQMIRQVKEKEREKIREMKNREKEFLIEWKKPRDDLKCDDLKALPEFETLPLPDGTSSSNFSDYLCIYQFFQSFPELLPIKEVCGTNQIKFKDLVAAIKCNQATSDNLFVQLMHVLLRAKADRADEEDGDEANLNNKEEISVDPSCDIDHKIFGEKVRQATLLHESVRLIYGHSARHLPIDWMTVTEVLRLNLMTAGYYTGTATHRFRLFSRGGPRCYEDEGFVFANNNRETMRKLKEKSVFELDWLERMNLFKVLIQQLTSYHKFRSLTDERINSLLELKKELKNLRNFDVLQEKEAREAKLLREYEAEQIEELGEAARTDLIKKDAPSAETQFIINSIKNASSISRRDDKLKDVEQLVMKGVSYGELEADEIDLVRSLQKKCFMVVEEELLKRIYKLHGRVGWNLLGRDRAFRSYWCIEPISLTLVENPSSHDETGPCEDPTPLDQVATESKAMCESNDQLRRKLMACTQSHDCPSHGKHTRPQWQFVSSVDILEKIEDACNPRGIREAELHENIKFFKPLLTRILAACCEKDAVHELCLDYKADSSSPGNSSPTSVMRQEFVEMLLDFEERVEQGEIGHLVIPESCTRNEWRQQLLERHNVSTFVKDDIQIFGDVGLTVDDVSRLNEVGQLALAFLQVVQGINLKFVRLPFATPSTKEKNCANIPTTTFDNWQKNLLKASSISALSLHFATLETCITWSRSRLQARCRTCKKRGDPDKLCICSRCDRYYHIDCVKPKIKERDGWMCSDCMSIQKAIMAEEKWKQKQALEDCPGNSSELEVNSACTSSGEMEEIDEVTARDELRMPEMLKTSSGRLVKKVIYDEVSIPEKNDTRRKKFCDDDRRPRSGNGDRLRSKRSSNGTARNVRMVTMSLRDMGSRSREILRSFETLIREAMKLQNAWPFLDPVDSKVVPDYYQIIKRPMDLRTIMNKLKQHLYDEPQQVIADARLIVDNCRIYNSEGSEICQYADELEEFLQRRFNSLLPQNDTDSQVQHSK